MRKRKLHILVGITSCVRNKKRRDACRETWLTRMVNGIDYLFYVGSKRSLINESDVVCLDARDDYGSLYDKLFLFFSYILGHYDFDWLFKCDDDTYVCLDRLSAVVRNTDCLFIGNERLLSQNAVSGGAGFFLKYELVDALVGYGKIKYMFNSKADDVILPRISKYLGAKVCASDKLWGSKNNAVPCYGNDVVSYVTANVSMMRKIFADFYK